VKTHTRKRLHLVAAVFFLVLTAAVLIPASPFSGLQRSVPFLVAISLYANFVGHLSGASAETPTEDD
jgi:hypothetical protein